MTTKKTAAAAMMTRLARMCIEQHYHYHCSAVELEQIQGKKIPVPSKELLRCRCCTKSEFETVNSPGIDCGRSYEIWKHCREPSGHRTLINEQDLNPEMRSIYATQLLDGTPEFRRRAVTLAIPQRTSHRLCLRSNMIYLSTTKTTDADYIYIVTITSYGGRRCAESCSV